MITFEHFSSKKVKISRNFSACPPHARQPPAARHKKQAGRTDPADSQHDRVANQPKNDPKVLRIADFGPPGP
ncbi:hypothetical protein [Bifidobacterium vespertilionis]|uniref:hypothetical protein n=1 Tax=Bifidobacterium vespertilionis TaxID=2562524 RepID=UPI001BDC01BC|nr:hypothetical protein [Bifidobacterium vespertilionis]MBT1179798.1 hypothetical protein [Bifidobacterium vespertilionis]